MPFGGGVLSPLLLGVRDGVSRGLDVVVVVVVVVVVIPV
jgi:hypothetical protein